MAKITTMSHGWRTGRLLTRYVTWHNTKPGTRSVTRQVSKHVTKQARRIALVLFGFAAVGAAAGPVKPPVPTDRNPGGTPVALLNAGIDYTKDSVAKMLARDGEGEIIGFDFVDNDRRPFKAPVDARKDDIVDVSQIILAEGRAATLIPIRVNLTDTRSVAEAIGYAAKCPTNVIAIENSVQDHEFAAVITAAAEHFGDKLFIVPAGYQQARAGGDKLDSMPKLNLPNVLVTTFAIEKGDLNPEAHSSSFQTRGDTPHDIPATAIAQIAVPGEARNGPKTGTDYLNNDQRSFARVIALAARLQSVEPSLTGPAIKSRILALAVPFPENRVNRSQNGWITEPWRYFFAE